VQVLQQKKLHSFWWTCQFEADQEKQPKKTSLLIECLQQSSQLQIIERKKWVA
jgi:hypothetical protein